MAAMFSETLQSTRKLKKVGGKMMRELFNHKGFCVLVLKTDMNGRKGQGGGS